MTDIIWVNQDTGICTDDWDGPQTVGPRKRYIVYSKYYDLERKVVGLLDDIETLKRNAAAASDEVVRLRRLGVDDEEMLFGPGAELSRNRRRRG